MGVEAIGWAVAATEEYRRRATARAWDAEVRRMSKGIARMVLTILMYAGVAVFCIPYLLGQYDGLTLYQIGGAAAAVVFGLTRCYWSEEECWWHVRP